MKLDSFRVTEFRSVQDSGWIDTEQITALIGTNESGKTNILLPLWKLNPADEGAIDLKDDLPRDKYHVYRESNPKPVFIYAKYVLSEKEKIALAKLSGHKTDEFAEVIVSKDYDENLFWAFPYEQGCDPSIIDTARTSLNEYRTTLTTAQVSSVKTETERREKACAIMEKALTALDGTANIKSVLSAAHDELTKFDEDVKSSVACATIAEAIQKISEMVSECDKPTLDSDKTVIEYLEANMPKYVYYSNYGNLDSQIYLPQVLQNIGKKDLGIKESAKARTLKTLFKFVQLDPNEITELGTESTGNLTQDQINKIADKKKERENTHVNTYGFKKYGRTLHRFVSEDISQVIHFQSGMPVHGMGGLLCVNLGIRIPECSERTFHPKTEKNKYYHEYECTIRSRLGSVSGKNETWYFCSPFWLGTAFH